MSWIQPTQISLAVVTLLVLSILFPGLAQANPLDEAENIMETLGCKSDPNCDVDDQVACTPMGRDDALQELISGQPDSLSEEPLESATENWICVGAYTRGSSSNGSISIQGNGGVSSDAFPTVRAEFDTSHWGRDSCTADNFRCGESWDDTWSESSGNLIEVTVETEGCAEVFVDVQGQRVRLDWMCKPITAQARFFS